MALNEPGWDAGAGGLIDAIIQQESSGNPKAVSPKGARGLMQVMPATAAQYGVHPDQLFDPNINRQVGTRYFGDLMQKYNHNPFLALVAYNSGPGRVDKGEFLPDAIKYASSVLGRVGKSVKGGFEGTANAEDIPPPPPGYGPAPQAAPEQAAAPAESSPAESETPPPPPGYGDPRQTPYRPSFSFGPSGPRVSLQPSETTGEATNLEKMNDQRQRLITLGDEMQDLFSKRIAPKLQAGKISSTGQGLDYTETGPMREMGYKVDPDVEDWIVKSGQFSQALNSYYAASGGGRGGVGYFGEVTSPHVPHPPQGLREVLGIWSPTGQQWDLSKQGEQLPILLHNLRRDQGIEGREHYQQWSPAEMRLLQKHGG